MKADVIMQSPSVFPGESAPASGGSPEDQRALQIALELSNLGGLLGGNCDDDASTSSFDEKNKKSQNMTECVPVPSSEHVAEIVGRQGCKIKALRAKTNTYIKTPVRGEEPVFVVTGRKEDVAMARREVQSAAEHFTQIRASRNRHAALMNGQTVNDSNSGTITLQVRVPYRVVGLVVGPKGATIKRIQQQTHTYIVTPSRDKEPVFEVTGLPENVEKAKEEIEAHIAARTGTQQVSVDDDFKNNGTEVGGSALKPPPVSNTAYKASMTASSVASTISAFQPYTNLGTSSLRTQAPSFVPSVPPPPLRQELLSAPPNNQMNSNNRDSSFASTFVPGFPIPPTFDPNDSNSMFGPMTGLGAWRPGGTDTQFPFTPLRSSSATGSTGSTGFSPTSSFGSGTGGHRLSPTFSDPDFTSSAPFLSASASAGAGQHQTLRRVGSDSVDSSASSLDLASLSNNFSQFMPTPALNIESGYSSGGTSDSLTSGSPVESVLLGNQLSPPDGSSKQRCMVCREGSIVAALVPCGHNNFCYTCADRVVTQPHPTCPCCSLPAQMAIVIKK